MSVVAGFSLSGPANAAGEPDSSSALLNAVCIDVAGSAPCRALRAWEDLSQATTNMSMYLERQPSDILAAALQAAHAQEAMSGLTSGQAATDMEAATRAESGDAPDDSRHVGIVPHSSVPLSSYDPSYWPLCHPLHFPYGIGGHGASRIAALSDETWCRHLLLRGDRGDDTAWCRSLPLVAVLFSTLHRRRLLRAIRVRLSSPSGSGTVRKLEALRSADFMQVYNLLGTEGASNRISTGDARASPSSSDSAERRSWHRRRAFRLSTPASSTSPLARLPGN